MSLLTTPESGLGDTPLNQLALFDEDNPLRGRFGSSFLKQAPSSAGVYWMLDRRGNVIYVGKAKNLKNRLRSYHATTRERLAPKIWRLVLKTEDIQWQATATETEALLVENRLLRELKPEFNVLNTRPETYLYLAHRRVQEGLELRLIFDLNEVLPEENAQAPEIHGAFKGIERVTRAFTALARWSWAYLCEDTAWPHPLDKKTGPRRIFIPPAASSASKVSQDSCMTHLGLMLAGLKPLPELILPAEEPPLYLQRRWRDDQLLLTEFFEKNCTRLKNLKQSFHREGRLILQHELDDLAVLA